MMNASEIIDEADAAALLPEKRARCQAKADLIQRSGRSFPVCPVFAAGDVLGESDALDLYEARLTAAVKSAAGSLKDSTGPAALAEKCELAEREIAAASAAIRAAGGDVPKWTLGSSPVGTLDHCASLQTYASKLKQTCQDACITIPPLPSQPVATKNQVGMNETERALAARAGKDSKPAQAEGESTLGNETQRVLARYGVTSLQELAAKRRAETNHFAAQQAKINSTKQSWKL